MKLDFVREEDRHNNRTGKSEENEQIKRNGRTKSELVRTGKSEENEDIKNGRVKSEFVREEDRHNDNEKVR